MVQIVACRFLLIVTVNAEHKGIIVNGAFLAFCRIVNEHQSILECNRRLTVEIIASNVLETVVAAGRILSAWRTDFAHNRRSGGQNTDRLGEFNHPRPCSTFTLGDGKAKRPSHSIARAPIPLDVRKRLAFLAHAILPCLALFHP